MKAIDFDNKDEWENVPAKLYLKLKKSTPDQKFKENKDDHRLTLRIPKWLMKKIDDKRKQRVGKISRNLLILEALEQATL